MPDLIAASDLVICQAGYNTLAEVEKAQVPAIVIPVEKELDDQFLRAREAAKLNQHLHIFEGSDRQYLADLIVDVMRIPAMVKQKPFEDTTTGRELRT